MQPEKPGPARGNACQAPADGIWRLRRFPAIPLAVAGIAPVIAGMAWLSRITPGTPYLPGVLGPMILFVVGMGLAMVPLTTAALAGVRPEDSAAASSMVNATRQVGGALGLAVLVTVSGAARRDPAGRAQGTTLASEHEHLMHGMASAFTVATLFDAGALWWWRPPPCSRGGRPWAAARASRTSAQPSAPSPPTQSSTSQSCPASGHQHQLWRTPSMLVLQ